MRICSKLGLAGARRAVEFPMLQGYMCAMRRISIPILAALLAAAPAGLAGAQGKWKSLGKFDGWESFSSGEGKARTCFALSRPAKSEPANARRGDHYLMITHRPADNVRNEVNYAAGYPLKKDAPVEALAGPQKFTLVVFDQKDYEEHAFAATPELDAQFAAALAKGPAAANLTVKAVSQRGTQTVDTFSLKGAAQALKAIGDACK